MSDQDRPQRPLYRRVHDAVLARIVEGDLPAGSMLPSEFDIAAEFGVSQGTARKALMALEQAGVLERRQGRGTFVAVTTPERALFHFFRLRDAEGRQVVPELVAEEVRRRAADPADRDAFGAVEEVIELSRIRAIDGETRIREVIRVPATLFPGLAERAPLPNTLYVLFQKAFGVAVVRAEEALTAVAAGTEDAAALGVAEGTPLLEARRRAIDLGGRVVETRVSRYRLDGHHYRVDLS